jgi:hypothetical protein
VVGCQLQGQDAANYIIGDGWRRAQGIRVVIILVVLIIINLFFVVVQGVDGSEVGMMI